MYNAHVEISRLSERPIYFTTERSQNTKRLPFCRLPVSKRKNIYISLFLSFSLFFLSLITFMYVYIYIYIKSLYMYISYIYNLSLSVHIYLYVYVCNLRTQSSWSVLLFVACYTVYMHITKIQAKRKKIFIIYIYLHEKKERDRPLLYKCKN